MGGGEKIGGALLVLWELAFFLSFFLSSLELGSSDIFCIYLMLMLMLMEWKMELVGVV